MSQERGTLTDDVIARLREQILDGALKPQARLHEEVLATSLGVSRTPVRDALRVLANEGLLIHSPNRGYVVRDFGLRDVLDAYDIRGNLEGMACRMAAERGLSATTRARLGEIVERAEAVVMGAVWSAAEEAEWRALNLAFHAEILEAVGNRQLIGVVHQMRRIPRIFDKRLEPQHAFYQLVYSREQRQRSHAEHREILEVLVAGEGMRAEALMREHVWRNRQALLRALPALEPVGELSS